MVKPLAYITSAWSDNEYEAKSTALRYSRQLYDAGYSPICPRLIYEGLLKDDVPQEHKDRVDMSAELLRRCRIVVVCGSCKDEQVNNDVALAQNRGIAVVTLNGILEVADAAGKKA